MCKWPFVLWVLHKNTFHWDFQENWALPNDWQTRENVRGRATMKMFSSDLTKQNCWHEVNKWIKLHPNREGKASFRSIQDYWHSREAEVFGRFLKHIHAQTASGVRCCSHPCQCQVRIVKNVGLGAVKGLSGNWQRTRSQSFTETDACLYESWHLLSTRLCVTFLG